MLSVLCLLLLSFQLLSCLNYRTISRSGIRSGQGEVFGTPVLLSISTDDENAEIHVELEPVAGAEYYEVEVVPLNTLEPKSIRIPSIQIDRGEGITVRGLVSYTEYKIRVKAVRKQETSKQDELQTTTKADIIPPIDRLNDMGVLASEEEGFSLAWTKPENSDASTILVRVKDSYDVVLMTEELPVSTEKMKLDFDYFKDSPYKFEIFLRDINGLLQTEPTVLENIVFSQIEGESVNSITGLEVTAESDGQISIGWDDVDLSDTSFVLRLIDTSLGREVYRGEKKPGEIFQESEDSLEILQADFQTNTMTISGFYGVKEYIVQARLRRGTSYSSWEEVAIETTDSTNNIEIEIISLVAFSPTPAVTNIVLSWASPEVTVGENTFLVPDYKGVKIILRNQNGTIIHSYVANRAETSYVFPDVFPAKFFTVTMQAFDFRGNSGVESDTRTVIPSSQEDTTPPSAVRGVEVEVEYKEQTVDFIASWTRPTGSADGDIAKYIVLLKDNDNQELRRMEVENPFAEQARLQDIARAEPGGAPQSYSVEIGTVDYSGNQGDFVQYPNITVVSQLSAIVIPDLINLNVNGEIAVSRGVLKIEILFKESPGSYEAFVVRMLQGRTEESSDTPAIEELDEVAVRILSNNLQRVVQVGGRSLVFQIEDGVLFNVPYTFVITVFNILTGERSEEKVIGTVQVGGTDPASTPPVFDPLPTVHLSSNDQATVTASVYINEFDLMSNPMFGIDREKIASTDLLYEGYLGEVNASVVTESIEALIESGASRRTKRGTKRGTESTDESEIVFSFPGLELGKNYAVGIRVRNTRSIEKLRDTLLPSFLTGFPAGKPMPPVLSDISPNPSYHEVGGNKEIRISLERMTPGDLATDQFVRNDVYVVEKSVVDQVLGDRAPLYVREIAYLPDTLLMRSEGTPPNPADPTVFTFVVEDAPEEGAESKVYYIGMRSVLVGPGAVVSEEATTEIDSEFFTDHPTILVLRTSNAQYPQDVTLNDRVVVTSDTTSLTIQIEKLSDAELTGAKTRSGEDATSGDIVYTIHYLQGDVFGSKQVLGDENPVVLNDLMPGSRYQLLLRAEIEGDPDAGDVSGIVSTETVSAATAPSISALSVNARTSTSFMVSWDFMEGITRTGGLLTEVAVSYNVYLVEKGDGSRSVEEVIGEDTTIIEKISSGRRSELLFDSLSENTIYEIVVEAVNETDTTKKSFKQVDAYTSGAESPPSQILFNDPNTGADISNITADESSITFSWAPPMNTGRGRDGVDLEVSNLGYRISWVSGDATLDFDSNQIQVLSRLGLAKQLEVEASSEQEGNIVLVLGGGDYGEDRLLSGTTYYIMVEAIYKVNDFVLVGAPSSVIEAETISDATAPPMAINIELDDSLENTRSTNSLALRWMVEVISSNHRSRTGDTLLPRQISYMLHMAIKSGERIRTPQEVKEEKTRSIVLSGTSVSTVLQGLTRGTTYEIVVESINTTTISMEAAQTTLSDVATFSTLQAATAPSAPVGLQIDAATESAALSLSWETPTNTGRKDDGSALSADEIIYAVYYLQGSLETDQVNAQQIKEVNSGQINSGQIIYTDPGVRTTVIPNLFADTSYLIVVESQNRSVVGEILATLGELQEGKTNEGLILDGDLSYPGSISVNRGTRIDIEPDSIPAPDNSENTDLTYSLTYSILYKSGTRFQRPDSLSAVVLENRDSGKISIDSAGSGGMGIYTVTVGAEGYNSKSADVQIEIIHSDVNEIVVTIDDMVVSEIPVTNIPINADTIIEIPVAFSNFAGSGLDSLDLVNITLEKEGDSTGSSPRGMTIDVNFDRRSLVLGIDWTASGGTYKIVLTPNTEGANYYMGSKSIPFVLKERITPNVVELEDSYPDIDYRRVRGTNYEGPAPEVRLRPGAMPRYSIYPVNSNRRLIISGETATEAVSISNLEDEGSPIAGRVLIDSGAVFSFEKDSEDNSEESVIYTVKIEDESGTYHDVKTSFKISISYVSSLTFDDVNRSLSLSFNDRGTLADLPDYTISTRNNVLEDVALEDVEFVSMDTNIVVVDESMDEPKLRIEGVGETSLVVTSTYDDSFNDSIMISVETGQLFGGITYTPANTVVIGETIGIDVDTYMIRNNPVPDNIMLSLEYVSGPSPIDSGDMTFEINPDNKRLEVTVQYSAGNAGLGTRVYQVVASADGYADLRSNDISITVDPLSTASIASIAYPDQTPDLQYEYLLFRGESLENKYVADKRTPIIRLVGETNEFMEDIGEFEITSVMTEKEGSCSDHNIGLSSDGLITGGTGLCVGANTVHLAYNSGIVDNLINVELRIFVEDISLDLYGDRSVQRGAIGDLGPAVGNPEEGDYSFANDYVFAIIGDLPEDARYTLSYNDGNDQIELDSNDKALQLSKERLVGLVEETEISLSRTTPPLASRVILTYSPSHIYTIEDLNAVRNDVTRDYELMRDLEFPVTGNSFLPIGSSTNPFSGIFDGAGNSITGLRIDSPTETHQGLFASIRKGEGEVAVRDLTLIRPEVTAKSIVGALAGILSSGIIENVTVIGSTVSGNEISNEGHGAVGSVVGLVETDGVVRLTRGIDINASFAIGIRREDESLVSASTGGLVGLNKGSVYGYVYGSAGAGSVLKGNRKAVGGLVGYNLGTVVGFVTGNVSIGDTDETSTTTSNNKDLSFGGLVGISFDGSTVIGYAGPNANDPMSAMGVVVKAKNYVGGLVGQVQNAASIKGYFLGNLVLSARDNFIGGIAGLVGQYSGENNLIGYVRGEISAIGNKNLGQVVGGIPNSIAFSYDTNDKTLLYSSNLDINVPGAAPNNIGTEVEVLSDLNTSTFSALTDATNDADTVGAFEVVAGQWPSIYLGPDVPTTDLNGDPITQPVSSVR